MPCALLVIAKVVIAVPGYVGTRIEPEAFEFARKCAAIQAMGALGWARAKPSSAPASSPPTPVVVSPEGSWPAVLQYSSAAVGPCASHASPCTPEPAEPPSEVAAPCSVCAQARPGA